VLLVVVGPAGPTMTNILSSESMMMHGLANPKYYVIKNVTYYVIKNVTYYVIKNVTYYVIKNVTYYVIKNVTYYVIKNVTYFGSRWSKSRKHNSRVSCDR